jgi:TPR repeat protein
VATFSAQSAAGNQNANIALVRIQHWCNRVLSAQPVDSKAQLDRIAPLVSPQRLARAAGVYVAERAYMERARQGCSKAHFDFGAIEARLRAAAESGDPASATELAQFLRDPAQHQALLERAAAKNFAPAQYALATNRLIAVRKGQTTENVASIRLLLKLAGQSLSRAKVDLANCMALGCDGHPADTATAAAFGSDAARDGEPLAFVSMVQMPWGGQLTRVQILAWQYYGDKLNELGCTGDAYIPNSVAFARTLAMLEKGQDAKLLEQARAQLDTLWQQNGERARKQQGCD